MKRQIKNIHIDGMGKSGKTSIVREMRSFLKDQDKDLHEITNTDDKSLDLQLEILSSDPNAFILKENSVLNLFYKDIKNGDGIRQLSSRYEDMLRKERIINNQHGSVCFFLMPTPERSNEIYPEGIPHYVTLLDRFFKDINQLSLTQGLDIRLVLFDELDKIYDVRDKILKILEDEYNL